MVAVLGGSWFIEDFFKTARCGGESILVYANILIYHLSAKDFLNGEIF
jgi:hypothetical protein